MRQTYRQLITIIFLALAITPCMAMPPVSAASIMSELKKKIVSHASVEAVFTIKSDDVPLEGSIIMSESKFSMKTPPLSVWYDGKTQWTLIRTSKEVGISEPTADELMLTNPFAILTSYDGYYAARRLPDISGRQRVELIPKDKNAGFESIVVTVNTTTYFPESIIVNLDKNRKIDLTIDKISGASKKADATFIFDAKKYPGFEINDLR